MDDSNPIYTEAEVEHALLFAAALNFFHSGFSGSADYFSDDDFPANMAIRLPPGKAIKITIEYVDQPVSPRRQSSAQSSANAKTQWVEK